MWLGQGGMMLVHVRPPGPDSRTAAPPTPILLAVLREAAHPSSTASDILELFMSGGWAQKHTLKLLYRDMTSKDVEVMTQWIQLHRAVVLEPYIKVPPSVGRATSD